MNSRRNFIKTGSIITTGAVLSGNRLWAQTNKGFVSQRPPLAERRFTSKAVEATIKNVKNFLPNKELGWMFENCFPNTLDTTIFFEEHNGKPDTYVITGDIDAMWLRDSAAQVWPYVPLAKQDKPLQQMIAGVINRQTKCILKDPYANAFYKDENKISEWKDDITDMKPGIHERKWEVDSLCFPIRLAHEYWKTTGDTKPFDSDWKEAISLTVQTFKEQQRKAGNGPYTFQRKTSWATDGVPMSGYGYPVNPVGLICSVFRASDDATVFLFHIADNFFASVSLKQAAAMLQAIHKDAALANACNDLATEIDNALKKYATVTHKDFGEVYAYEVNGFGSYLLMDDAATPSLLSLPYLDALSVNDKVYQQTRKLIFSNQNPFFYKGKYGESIGSPHAGEDMLWPLAITTRALTSTSEQEIIDSIKMLINTHAGTGFIHESFHKEDPSKFTRKWFAWANTLFGELILHLYNNQKFLLKKI